MTARARRSALIAASVPEETRRTISTDGTASTISAASSTSPSVGAPKLAERLLAAGADAITLGNHTWRRQEIGPYLASSDRIVRPANFAASTPGQGLTVVQATDGTPVAVLNVMGSLSLQPASSMWELVDDLVDRARAETPVVLVDVHAEATSEKVALARWLDGRVTAVIGTHTHVQTADARVQPGGTAAITDAGMRAGRPSGRS